MREAMPSLADLSLAREDGPLFAYRALVEDGAIRRDPLQEIAAQHLQSIYLALRQLSHKERGFLSRLLRRGEDRASSSGPHGLYLFGPVGRGKSMLMDLLMHSAPVPAAAKRRVHFHSFMHDLHQAMHRWRRRHDGNRNKTDDPIEIVLRSLTRHLRLLCFDEFQVLNIADAMILARVLRALFERRIAVVMTSNTPPEQLYEGGLQRANFLPCIALIQEKMQVVSLLGDQDYRRAAAGIRHVYVTPISPENSIALRQSFDRLRGSQPAQPLSLHHLGRTLMIPLAAGDIAWFDFASLCEEPLGAADYLLLAENFPYIFIDSIPQLESRSSDVVFRFITLIDALYDRRCNLLCTAAAKPDELYVEGRHSTLFQRTASRLYEMQTEDYWQAPKGNKGQLSQR